MIEYYLVLCKLEIYCITYLCGINTVMSVLRARLHLYYFEQVRNFSYEYDSSVD